MCCQKCGKWCTFWPFLSKVFSKPCQISKTEIFCENRQRPLTIFLKCFILDAWHKSEYVAVYCLLLITYVANIYLLKINNKNTRKRCETCSNLTIKTPFSNVSIVDFEHVNVSCVGTWLLLLIITSNAE